MKKRRSEDQVARLLKNADRDLAKGSSVADICRKVGVAQTTFYRFLTAAAPRAGAEPVGNGRGDRRGGNRVGRT